MSSWTQAQDFLTYLLTLADNSGKREIPCHDQVDSDTVFYVCQSVIISNYLRQKGCDFIGVSSF